MLQSSVYLVVYFLRSPLLKFHFIPKDRSGSFLASFLGSILAWSNRLQNNHVLTENDSHQNSMLELFATNWRCLLDPGRMYGLMVLMVVVGSPTFSYLSVNSFITWIHARMFWQLTTIITAIVHGLLMFRKIYVICVPHCKLIPKLILEDYRISRRWGKCFAIAYACHVFLLCCANLRILDINYRL